MWLGTLRNGATGSGKSLEPARVLSLKLHATKV